MKEITAIEALGTPYMTKVGEIAIEDRIYCTAIAGVNPKIENWRGASAEEREEWQRELEALNPIDNISEVV